ncbi:predicted protein [Fibroporia radiculosa]|uniref:Uncharacterized protein n=1 Tax=Fibroporia radiculosa TaxID=599839 RepID=J4H5I9_9APHY|nr:predicted protein [Fibroporia radiculosa]
MKGEANRV